MTGCFRHLQKQIKTKENIENNNFLCLKGKK